MRVCVTKLCEKNCVCVWDDCVRDKVVRVREKLRACGKDVWYKVVCDKVSVCGDGCA